MLDYNTLCRSREFMVGIDNLFSRWLDEQQYEDINDYAPVIVSLIKKHNGQDVEIADIKAVRRPFGIKFTTPNDGKRWQLKRTMSYMSIMRIA